MENPSATELIASALQPRTPPNFTFITISNPKDIKDSKKQTAIRRHARISASRSKPQKRKPLQLTFDLPLLDDVVLPHVEQATAIHEEQDPEQNLVAVPVSTERDGFYIDVSEAASRILALSTLRPLSPGLGASPMSNLPGKPSARSLQLVAYLHDSMEMTPRPLGPVWFTVAMADKSAFYLTVANAALFFGRESHYTVGENAESIKYYNASMNSIKKRLKHPVDGVSEGVIGSVLGFACHDHAIANSERANIHMDGVEKIIQLRGGIETLKPFHVLRLVLFWIDVNDSFSVDKKPRFPLPKDLILEWFEKNHEFSILDSITTEWDIAFPALTDIPTTLTSIAKVSQFINDKSHTLRFWRDDWFMSRRYIPVLHQILSLHRVPLLQADINQGLVLREAIRLSSLILFSLIHRKFSIPPDQAYEYQDRFMDILLQFPVDWAPFLDLKLWVLVISGLISEGEGRAWHIAEIVEVMGQLGLKTRCEVFGVVKEIIWVDAPLDEEARRLADDIGLPDIMDDGI